MESIKNLLGKSLRRANISHQVELALALEEFSKIVSQEFEGAAKDRVQALYIRDGVITVACLSAPLAQELKFRERIILDKLNKVTNSDIKKIRYLV